MPFYANHLPEYPKSILEIGIKEGASIRMWMTLFPEAKIYGLDLFEEFPEPDIEGVEWIKGHQCDHELLYHIRHDISPEVIIDDGSHVSGHQMVSFFSLMQRNTVYFIEDVHCATDPFYRDLLPFDFTAASVFKKDLGFYYSDNYETYTGSQIVVIKHNNIKYF